MTSLREIAKWFNRRRRLIAFALTGWIVLVVVGAGRAPNSGEWVNAPDLGGLLIFLAGLGILFFLVLFLALRPAAKSRRGLAQKRSRRIPIVGILLFLLLLYAFAPRQDAADEVPVDTPPPVAAQDETGNRAVERGEDGIETIDVMALLVIGAAAAGVLVFSARRGAFAGSSGAGSSVADLAADLAPAIDEAAERLKLGSEPRAAVIAAYAGLERALAARGFHRHPAETPTEHMSRVLSSIPTLADPAVRLGALYEVARFSNRIISEADRRQAMAALDQARATFSATVDHGQ